jgi:FdhD protein
MSDDSFTDPYAQILRYDGESLIPTVDELAEEEPLEIRVRGRGISITMRTPGHDDELAAGFLLTEGVVHCREDLLRIEHCGRNEFGNVINVVLAPQVYVDMQRLTRHVFASSSCGLCGKSTIDAIARQFPPLQSNFSVDAQTILGMSDAMRAAQTTFARTGGLHAAAIFDADGRMRIVREDVGRHNAVDKAIGHCLLHGNVPLSRQVLLVSGRSSFEIMQKALGAGIAVVAAVSAPSSLAVRFAEQSGQTLIGFLRGSRMNLYTHPSRICFRGASSPQPASVGA